MTDHPVIVFDGKCILCSTSAEFVLRWDRHKRFRFTTAQSPIGRQYYVDNGLDPDAMATMIVVARGRAHIQSDAILTILDELGWPWRIATVARIVPRALRDRAYRWIARNRIRWIGTRETCWLPDARYRDRVL